MIKEIVATDICPVFLQMLQESEKRIDKTSTMVLNLVEATNNSIKMFDKFIASIENSRNASQLNNSELIKKSNSLTAIVEKEKRERHAEKECADREIARLLKVLETEKEEKMTLRKQLHEASNEYKEMFKTLTDLVKANSGAGAKAQVRIGK